MNIDWGFVLTMIGALSMVGGAIYLSKTVEHVQACEMNSSGYAVEAALAKDLEYLCSPKYEGDALKKAEACTGTVDTLKELGWNVSYKSGCATTDCDNWFNQTHG